MILSITHVESVDIYLFFFFLFLNWICIIIWPLDAIIKSLHTNFSHQIWILKIVRDSILPCPWKKEQYSEFAIVEYRCYDNQYWAGMKFDLKLSRQAYGLFYYDALENYRKKKKNCRKGELRWRFMTETK